MGKLFMANVEGFSKEEAMSQIDLEIKHNATAAWRAAGEPTYGTEKFKLFAEKFIEKNKMTTGGGAYIQKLSPVPDTRTKPYKVVNFKKKGVTKWRTVYNICEAELDLDKNGKYNSIVSIGVSVDNEAQTKADAEERMKTLISNTKKNYVVRKTKEVVEDPDSENGEILCVGVYTPSVSTMKGEFYVFGLSKE